MTNVCVLLQATSEDLSKISSTETMAVLVRSKALTVKDVASIGVKLCQIDVDTFSALLSSPAVVGV